MGVPKFYRFISERYPLISTVVAADSIPAFDNLYLDMNGIIHNCSHPTDMSFLTKEQILLSIFNYIDHIFKTIKPQRLFFMAVDGVAPRAKMNQQRSRRFRTAKQAEIDKAAAIRKGTLLPDSEDAFDSNCITPGTDFMVDLSLQLHYFCNKKVSEDPLWQGVEIVLSGHEGEGEHKIMEYIRLAKSNQATYNPNTRHCMYGLDADLIMLGLLSHEPHFALLREEVTFGRKKPQHRGSSSKAEQTQFHLLHLSLFREYLDLEFSELKSVDGFVYSLERVIDDFILICMFIGNDFLPHLPGIHINEGALGKLFGIYKQITAETRIYLQTSGTINLPQLQLLLDLLSSVEHESYKANLIDTSFMRGKRIQPQGRKDKKTIVAVNDDQVVLFKRIRSFVADGKTDEVLEMDRKFVQDLCKELGLICNVDMQVLYDEDEDTSDEESELARGRVIAKYDAAPVTKVDDLAKQVNVDPEIKYQHDFALWKSEYYREKLEFTTRAEHAKMVFHYIEGLQWVLFYYYIGCPSWEWFYPYHYAPKITDLHSFPDAFTFKLGTPFLPYQQLMGVLPSASAYLLPPAYRVLMTEGPIVDFYPEEFEQDMNGKKSDWEAVVKVPFIDEKRLIAALNSKGFALSLVERSRNTHSCGFSFTYTPVVSVYPSSLPGMFPDLLSNKCVQQEYVLPVMNTQGYLNDLCEGALIGSVMRTGFPSLAQLEFTSSLSHAGVQVFQAPSTNESIVLHIKPPFATDAYLPLLGKSVYVNYPYVSEAQVCMIRDDIFAYTLTRGKVSRHEHTPRAADEVNDLFDTLSCKSGKIGADIGVVDIILSVYPFKRTASMVVMSDGSTRKEFAEIAVDVAAQLCVLNEQVGMNEETKTKPVSVEFAVGEVVFCLGNSVYGCAAEIVGFEGEQISYAADTVSVEHLTRNVTEKYVPSFILAKTLQVNGLCLSRMTSSLYMITADESRIDIGLNLKFEGKQRKVVGMSRKSPNGWEFSDRACQLMKAYKNAFPEVWRYVDRNSKTDFYDVDAIFNKDAAKKVGELNAFMRVMGVKAFEQVPLETENLDAQTINTVELFLDRVNNNVKCEPRLVRGLGRMDVLKSSYALFRLSGQEFVLGDRVVNVTELVPAGAKGVVVGVSGGSVEVLLDEKNMNGTTLGNRGQSVLKTALLNLSNQQIQGQATHDNPYMTQPSAFERDKNSTLKFKERAVRIDNSRKTEAPISVYKNSAPPLIAQKAAIKAQVLNQTSVVNVVKTDVNVVLRQELKVVKILARGDVVKKDEGERSRTTSGIQFKIKRREEAKKEDEVDVLSQSMKEIQVKEKKSVAEQLLDSLLDV